MAEHTPGPWAVYGDGAITGGTNVMGDLVDLIVVGADGFPVAELPLTAILPDYIDRTGHSHWARGRGTAYVEREVEAISANAWLIAAAPDLFGVCADLVAFLELGEDETGQPCGDCTPDEPCGYHSLLADARAVIARARAGARP